ILQRLDEPKTTRFVSIIGSAGTGKTLLVYDIFKKLSERSKSILIIHCGQLNAGQLELIRCGWNITPIKNYRRYDLTNYDAIIIDETQRIYPNQLKDIVSKIWASNGTCIFSYDKLQTLSAWEEKSNIDAEINSIAGLVTHTLSEKIRTNKELANFLKGLFNNKRSVTASNQHNIDINYFENSEDAKRYLTALDHCGWEVLRFTPSQYGNEHHESYYATTKQTSHQVIGQEFEGVAVMIDQYFSYDLNGELYYKAQTYYHVSKMLFQNITRARKRLSVVIINNREVLERCLSILR
ncbi:DNA/RNA helicase domain-containing protein, partial [Pseudomonas sp. MH10]